MKKLEIENLKKKLKIFIKSAGFFEATQKMVMRFYLDDELFELTATSNFTRKEQVEFYSKKFIKKFEKLCLKAKTCDIDKANDKLFLLDAVPVSDFTNKFFA